TPGAPLLFWRRTPVRRRCSGGARRCVAVVLAAHAGAPPLSARYAAPRRRLGRLRSLQPQTCMLPVRWPCPVGAFRCAAFIAQGPQSTTTLAPAARREGHISTGMIPGADSKGE